MDIRKIGKTPLAVTEIGFGGAAIGGLDREGTREAAMETLQTAWDAGIRYFDTAPFYGFGLSERRTGDFLRDKPTLMPRVPPAPRARRDRVQRRTSQSAVSEADRELFQALRQKRLEIARAQNLPPYVIFHDKTLIELAAARPASRSEMASVPGVGEAKLERYGPAFLAVIAEHA